MVATFMALLAVGAVLQGREARDRAIADALADIVRRHPQVERILCGHHHRAIVGRLAQATVCVAPSVVQQTELALEHDSGRFVMEPPAFQLHVLSPAGELATHIAFVEAFPGPFPYIENPDYPGKCAG